MKKILMIILLGLMGSSCKKYLDTKPDKKLVIPTTIADAQALLDNYTFFNSSYPATGDQSDDNYFLDNDRYNMFRPDTRNFYVWSKDAIDDQDWTNMYQVILNATIASETLDRIEKTPANTNAWNAAKGAALFYRGYALMQVAEYYCEIYDAATAANKPGAPLRLSSDANLPSTRPSLADTWSHIISNFQQATTLLPPSSAVPSRPTKAAAWGALARAYLLMNNYPGAADAAGQCLQLHPALMDYNTLDSTAYDPFSRFNQEVIFPVSANVAEQLDPSVYSLDSSLYLSYAPNDLRVNMYFTPNAYGEGFKGSYDGDPGNGPFTGIATDEVLLIHAECLARLGKTADAMNDLNHLLLNRFLAGTFVPLTAANSNDALKLILQERRKELVMRGARWADLRRLGLDPEWAVTPQRIIAGKSYSLPPKSSLYTFLLPKQVIELSGMQQNVR